MNAVVMVSCSGAICYGPRGWWFPMWIMLMVAAVVAGATLSRESRR